MLTEPVIAPDIEKTMIHIAAAVAQRTPLPTVLLREMDSVAASDHEAFSALSANFLINEVTSFKSLGKRNASAPTEERRQRVARMRLFLKMNVGTAIARQIRPKINVDLLNLYAVSLLSKMISLTDVLSAFKIAYKGIRHSISTAPRMTPITSAAG